MRIKVKEKNIIVEFPLTQSKRSWKIRTDGKKSADKILEYRIQKTDHLEWMVDYQELRDILYCFKEENLPDFEDIQKKFHQLCPQVDKPEDAIPRSPIRVGNIIVERQFLPKQRKITELFPYVFVLFGLFYTIATENMRVFLVDIYDKKITNTDNRKITFGDTLIWLPLREEISEIMGEFAILSKKHKEKAKEEIFDKIENI